MTKFNLTDKLFKRDGDTNETKFANAIRISKVSDALSKSIENNKFKSKDGAGPIFISVLGSWDEEDTMEEDLGARYLGTSLVFFPCYKQVDDETRKTKDKVYSIIPSGIIMCMGMGTGGPGPDENLVSNPGHMRRFEGMIKSLRINRPDIPVWWRNDPLLKKPVPNNFIKNSKDILDSTPYTLHWRDESSGGYGQYLYAIVVLKFDDTGNFTEFQKKLLNGFSEFYFRERGWKQNCENDPALKWFNELFGSKSKEEIEGILNKEKFVILSGPPGTRKTELLKEISNNKQFINRSISYQFHPSVTYQSFVGGIQPRLQDASAAFEFHKGPFLQAIEESSRGKKETILLALDEINRADLPSILGEAIQLFEPTQQYELDITNYNKNPVKMPENLMVLATMNTADRNIIHIDVAIRRRFAFVNIWPEEPSGNNSCDYGRNWFNKLKMIFLEYGEDTDLLLMPGGFYFLGSHEEKVKDCFRYRLLSLLKDYLDENRLSQKIRYEIELLIQEITREI